MNLNNTISSGIDNTSYVTKFYKDLNKKYL